MAKGQDYILVIWLFHYQFHYTSVPGMFIYGSSIIDNIWYTELTA